MNNRATRLSIVLGLALIASIATTLAVAQDGRSASAAFESVMADIEEINVRASKEPTMDGKLRLIAEAESLLIKFRAQYPRTPEAYEAAFQLGALNQNIASFTQEEKRWNDAIRYLSEFVINGEEDPRKKAFARYYLAESYRGAGKFDEAVHEYKLILDRYPSVNAKLTQIAEMNIKNIETERRLAVGSEPIDFSVTGLNGEKLSPSEFKGKVLLIDFWATWCAPCTAELPHLKNVYKKYNDNGFEIVGISLDRSRGALDKFIAKHDIKWPQFYDGKYFNNEVAVQYGVKQIPTTYLIDREGKIRYKSLRGEQLEVAVKKLINEG